jgi:hypothetical protein
MTQAIPFPSNPDHGADWRPAGWHEIRADDLLALTQQKTLVAMGRVEDFAPDRSVFWIRHCATGERQLFLTEDALVPWLPQ